jgi:hypothetical protein
MRRALPLLAVLALAGCGGTARHAAPPPQPKLPRLLAQSWKQQAYSVASALAAGDGCTAQRLSTALRASVIAAVNAHRVPRRFLDPLTSGVNELASQITCTPAPAPAPTPPGQERKKKHGKGHGHD